VGISLTFSGLKKDESGALNHPETTVNPLTGKPVTSCYGPGESYDSKFTTISKFTYCQYANK
jgi:hypothetical protein